MKVIKLIRRNIQKQNRIHLDQHLLVLIKQGKKRDCWVKIEALLIIFLYLLSSSDEDKTKNNVIKPNSKTNGSRSRSKSLNKEEIFKGLKITGLPSRNISKLFLTSFIIFYLILFYFFRP